MSTVWYVITGALLIGMALASSVLKRLPVTASMFYLTAGAMLGPWGADLCASASWKTRQGWSDLPRSPSSSRSSQPA